METNELLVIKFVALVICVLAAYVFGYLFTEKWDVPSKMPMFRFKAFECRKCLSFHTCWILTTTASLYFLDWVMLLIGVCFAALLFIGLWVDEKNKTIKIEKIS